MYAVQLICTIFFYLFNVQTKECTYDIFYKPILPRYNIQKKPTNIETQEQTASFDYFIKALIL